MFAVELFTNQKLMPAFTCYLFVHTRSSYSVSILFINGMHVYVTETEAVFTHSRMYFDVYDQRT